MTQQGSTDKILHVVSQALSEHTGALVAVSGGIDSVVLLDACARVSEEIELKLAIVHVDHSVRESSKADADFVQSLSEKYGFEFYLKKLGQCPSGVNFEAWARRERYRFFSVIMGRNPLLSCCLTAHHANDVTETLLIKLVSNKEPLNVLVQDPSRKLLRPLIEVNKKEIAEYAKAYELAHREDETNSDTAFLRNKVRHELIPHLEEKFGPSAIKALGAGAQRFSEDYQALYDLASRISNRLHGDSFETRQWGASALSALEDVPDAVAWRVLAIFFEGRIGYRIGRVKGLECLRCIRKEVVAVQFEGGKELRRSKGVFTISAIIA